MNKKAIAPKFIAGIVLMVVMLLLGLFMLLILKHYQSVKEQQFNDHLVHLDTSYQTRVITMQEYLAIRVINSHSSMT